MASKSDVRSNTEAVGILFGRTELEGCLASRTVFGSTRYRHATVAITEDDLSSAVAQLMAELGVADSTPVPISASIPTENCYFATRPIAAAGAKASPRTLLRESLRSSAARLDQMSIDVVNWQPDRRAVAGIIAAPIDEVEAVREAIASTPHSLQRLTPAAAALVAVAPEDDRERRNTLITRVFLSEDTLLAAMCRGSRPIHWQSFRLPAGDEGTGIVSAIRSLETAASACGLDRTPDTVIIHGRPEIQALTDQDWLATNLQNNFQWVETPTLTSHCVAKANASLLLSDEDDGFDFARQHRDPLLLRRVVPYKEMAAYVLAACVLAVVLWMRLGTIKDERTALLTTAPPMVMDGANPKPEKDRLNARASAVSEFLDKRVQWSHVLTEVTRSLPKEIKLTGIRASAPMSQRRKKQVKSSPTTLILNAECALDEQGNMPRSLDSLAERVQSVEVVGEHFKRVELSALRRTESQKTGLDGAEFSIVLTNDMKGGR